MEKFGHLEKCGQFLSLIFSFSVSIPMCVNGGYFPTICRLCLGFASNIQFQKDILRSFFHNNLLFKLQIPPLTCSPSPRPPTNDAPNYRHPLLHLPAPALPYYRTYTS